MVSAWFELACWNWNISGKFVQKRHVRLLLLWPKMPIYYDDVTTIAVVRWCEDDHVICGDDSAIMKWQSRDGSMTMARWSDDDHIMVKWRSRDGAMTPWQLRDDAMAMIKWPVTIAWLCDDDSDHDTWCCDDDIMTKKVRMRRVLTM